MKYGMFYGYWKRDWSGDYLPLVSRAKKCGFDILAVSSGYLVEKTEAELDALRREAEEWEVELHAGFGPGPDCNLASQDQAVVDHAFRYSGRIFQVLERLGIPYLGGNHYSCAPQALPLPIDKEGDRERLLARMDRLAGQAGDCGITLMMEVVCRYEGYLINTAEEGVAFLKELGKENVRLILDTFHMNIEEDSFSAAIHTAGKALGYFHIGECNRKLPGAGRIPWNEIRHALRQIHFDGPVTMEPFILPGGSIGNELGVWRDLSGGASEHEMDRMASESLQFMKYVLGEEGFLPEIL